MVSDNVLKNNDQNSTMERFVSLTDNQMKNFWKQKKSKAQSDAVLMMAFFGHGARNWKLFTLEIEEIDVNLS